MPDFRVGMQRHHLFPRQLIKQQAFSKFIEAIGRDRLGYDDFRRNGLLLPATEVAASQVGLPLHRGPHRAYNEMVMERFGQIEEQWSMRRIRAPEVALDVLQSALRKRLMQTSIRPFMLNRHDPLGKRLDFGDLDAMVDALWAGSQTPAR